MFDINSQERQAHHHFMALDSDQHKEISNHELFGNAAAYHAASAFTDHCEANGVPEDKSEAQGLMLGYAKEFVSTQIDTKGLKLDKEQAMKYAVQSLEPQMSTAGPEAWGIAHGTPLKNFDSWKSTEKQYIMPMKYDWRTGTSVPDYEKAKWYRDHNIAC